MIKNTITVLKAIAFGMVFTTFMACNQGIGKGDEKNGESTSKFKGKIALDILNQIGLLT